MGEPSKDSDFIQKINAIPIPDFYRLYVEDALSHVDCGQDVALSFHAPSTAPASLIPSCLDLVAQTSADAYRKSSLGWSQKDKLAEMQTPNMRFLVLSSPQEPARVVGFLSFMFCTEDDLDVVYCYEVHLQPHLRGRKLGLQLMKALEATGVRAGVDRAMLTVFTSNEAAIRFYKQLGFEWYDEEPPPPRKRLRSRLTPAPKPTYVILAKSLARPS